MAIQKQLIQIPLLKGVNTKVDPMQELPGSITILENAKFTKIGKISKRNGYDKLASNSSYFGGQLGSTFDTPLVNSLAVKGVATEPVVITKDLICRYTAGTEKLYTTRRYFPMSFFDTNESSDNYVQHNAQCAVWGDLVYVLHTKIQVIPYGGGDASFLYLSAFDTSTPIPTTWFTQVPLKINVNISTGTGAFYNSNDGGVTQGVFSITDGESINGKILSHAGSIYIFAHNLANDYLFYKRCNPKDEKQLISTAQSLLSADGGWTPFYDFDTTTSTNTSFMYDVISLERGLGIFANRTEAVTSYYLNLRVLPDEPFKYWHQEEWFDWYADALCISEIKQEGVGNYDEFATKEARFSIAWAFSGVGSFTTSSIEVRVYDEDLKRMWSFSNTTPSASTSDINDWSPARTIALQWNDNYYFDTAVDPNDTNASNKYFDCFVEYQKSATGSDPTGRGLLFYIDTTWNGERAIHDGPYPGSLRGLSLDSFAGGTPPPGYPGDPVDFVRNGDWSTVAFEDLEPWATTFIWAWEVFPDKTSAFGYLNTPFSDVTIDNFVVGAGLAAQPFRAVWGDSIEHLWSPYEMHKDEKSGQNILPITTQSTLQSSYYFLSLADYLNNTSPPTTAEITSVYGTDTGLGYYSDWVGIHSFGIGGGLLEDITAASPIGVPSLPKLSYLRTDAVVFPFIKQTRIITEDIDSNSAQFSSFYNVEQAAVSVITYEPESPNQSIEATNQLLIPGGLISNYADSISSEHGWIQSPYSLLLMLTPPSGSNMTEVSTASPLFAKGNIYNYVAIYKERDASGLIHRSSISKQMQVTITNTSTNTGYEQINVMVPMCTITDRTGQSPIIELYRTTNNGTVFYKVSGQDPTDANQYQYNDPGLVWIVLRDRVSDSSLTDNELLYTTGGILENTPVPSCTIMESYKNMIFIAGLPNPYIVQYSKVITPDYPAEFNDTLVIETPVSGGPITALKGMDDKLFIFKSNSIFFVAGGQNNFTSYLRSKLGQVTNIEIPILTQDIGCVNKNSVILTPLGIMFKSAKGIFLITRSMGLEYIGAPVEDYNNLKITSSVLYATTGEVRFLTDSSSAIIYNYERNVWFTFSNHDGRSNAVIDNTYYYLNKRNELLKEVEGFKDVGKPIPLKLETGWMSFAQTQGFQRVYHMLVLGEYKSSHELRVRVAYNYDNTWEEESIITITNSDSGQFIENPSDEYPFAAQYWTTNYGSQAWGIIDKMSGTTHPMETRGVYGDPEVDMSGIAPGSAARAYATSQGTQYQFRINFKKQKCEAIKISIEEFQDTDQTGEGVTLSNIAFLVGIKGGTYKVSHDRKTISSTSIPTTVVS